MFWQRSILKNNAKVSLRGKYGTSLGVSLVSYVISTAVAFIGLLILVALFSSDLNSMINSHISIDGDYGFGLGLQVSSLVFSLISKALFAIVVIFIGTLFLKSAMVVGSARFYLHKRFGDTHFSTLFTGFQQRWIHTVGVIFVTGLIIKIWSFAANWISGALRGESPSALNAIATIITIAGIVVTIYFALRYSYVDFLLADNPSLGGNRARSISSTLTNGEIGRVLLFYLSFIGWYLLALLASSIVCAIAVTASISSMIPELLHVSYLSPYAIASLIVQLLPAMGICALIQFVLFTLIAPYLQSTRAELYLFVRDRAINAGQLNPAELGLTPPQPQPQDPPVC